MSHTVSEATHAPSEDARGTRTGGCACRRPDRSDLQLLTRARTSFLLDEQIDNGVVRAPILASWKRAKQSALPANRIDLPLNADPSEDSPLLRAARPVVDEVADQFASEPISIILTDSDGVVLDRRTGDSSLHRHLDKVWLAPGFCYAESVIGTNGIGTALQQGGPARVFGHEHYVEDLASLACVGFPIHHPTTRKAVGVIDLTCWRKDANSVLTTAVHAMARRIEQALLEQVGRREVALMEEYLRACQQNRSAVLALGDDVVMINNQARELLDATDQAAVLTEAAEVLNAGRRRPVLLDLPSGATARLQCVSSSPDLGSRAGVLKLNLVATGIGPATPKNNAALLATSGSVGSGPLWIKSWMAVERHLRAGEWLILTGESGTGKATLAVAAHRRLTPTARLRVVDVAPSRSDWISEVADELAGGCGTLVLRHLDQLDDSGVQLLADALEPHRESTEAERVRVIATVRSGDTRTPARLGPLLAVFPHTVEVPPLRHHIEDVAELVPHLVQRLAHSAHLTFSADSMRLLMRNRWPGNVEQLKQVLSKIVAKRRTGVVRLADLPSECWSSTRRTLSPVEAIECDAIIDALFDKAGNKAEAAHYLGISRATIYRKIRDYGITCSRIVENSSTAWASNL